MNRFEQAAVDALLAGDHPALATLRAQVGAASIRDREVQEGGRFTDFWVEATAPSLDIDHRFSIDDVRFRCEGGSAEVQALLHVVRGRIKTLETFHPEEILADPLLVSELWYVTRPVGGVEPDRVESRDLGYALRGLDGDGEEDGR